MPNPTNPLAPQGRKYAEGRKDKGAAYRDSITFEAALKKLPQQSYRNKLQNIAEGRGTSKTFNSDPWPAYSSGTKGKEFDLDRGNEWRLIKHTGYCFLAKHVGAFKDFEFWHISDWPKKAPALRLSQDNGTTVQTPEGTPALAVLRLSASMGDSMVPVLAVPSSPGSASTAAQKTEEVPDSWEDAFDAWDSSLK